MSLEFALPWIDQLNLLPGGVAIFDKCRDSWHVHVNAAYAAVSGFSIAEVENMLTADVTGMIFAADLKEASAQWLRLVKGEEDKADITYRIVQKCGQPCWVRNLLSVVKRKSDGGCLIYATGVDASEYKQLEEQLRQEKERLLISEQRVQIALANTSVTFWDYDYAQKCIIQNDRSIDAHGFATIVPNVPDSLIDSGFVHADSAAAFRAMYAKLSGGAPKAEGVFKVQNKERSGYWYEYIRYTNVFNAEGQPYRAIGMSEDVTEKHEMQQKFERELLLQQIAAPDILASTVYDVTDWQVISLRNSAGDETITSDFPSIDSIYQEVAANIIDNEEAKAYLLSINRQTYLDRFASGQTSFEMEYKWQYHGRQLWVRNEARLLTDPENGHLMLFISARNIHEEKQQIMKLAAAAQEDAMTGLLNHEGFFEQAQHYLQSAGQAPRHALFMIDLDNFKKINDTFGHKYGDDTLVRVADIIKQVFFSTDIKGRIGGDEFMALMLNVASLDDVRHKAESLIQELQFVCQTKDNEIAVTCSVGVTVCGGAENDLLKLYEEADTALYQAKNNGKCQYRIHDLSANPSMRAPEVVYVDKVRTMQMQTLLEYMDGGVIACEITDDINITYISPSIYSSFHRSREELKADSNRVFDVVVAEDMPGLRAALFDTAASGRILEYSYRVRTADGIGWRHLRAARMPESGDGISRVVGVISDITAMKKAEIQRETIIENVPLGIGIVVFVQKAVAEITFMNKALENLLGVTLAELREPTPVNILSRIKPQDLDMVLTEVLTARREKRTSECVYHSRPDAGGNERLMRVCGVHMYDQNNFPVVLVLFEKLNQHQNEPPEKQLHMSAR